MSSSPPPSPRTEWQRYSRWLWLFLVGAAGAATLAAGTALVRAGDNADWAVVVVAGDWHAHDGSPSEIFDNARRDVAAALVNAGFKPANIAEFSVRPELYHSRHPLESDVRTIADTLAELTERAPGGCLLYFTSHGTPSGLVLGETILTPVRLDDIVSDICGERPSIVVVSACYSGVFVDALKGPNRMIVTAARRDRTSFGCGGTTRYPYFDACFLTALDHGREFPVVALATKRCVTQLEERTRMSPPSEPQIFIGKQIAVQLPTWR
jgi:hypothetical protein